jgi:hypothetical protein
MIDPTERRSYSYFQQETRRHISSFADYSFWDQLCLQQGRSEGSIRQVLVAIGAFHESMETADPAMRVSRRQTADAMYHRAISKAVTEIPQMPIASVLLTSILLAFLDNINGNMLGAHKHITSAAAIVKEYREAETLQSPSLVISRVLAPIVDQLYQVSGSIHVMPPTVYRTLPTARPFVNFLDAHNNFYATTDRLTQQLRSAYADSSTLNHGSMLDQLENWWLRFSWSLDNNKGFNCTCPWPANHAHHAMGSLFLEKVFLLARARLHSAVTCLDTTFDLYHDDFRQVLNNCERMIHILGSSTQHKGDGLARDCLGFAPLTFCSIWIVAEVCRDPFLRRRAAGMFRRRHDACMFWDTYCLADTAEAFISYEEANSPIQPVGCAADIPEFARTHFVHTTGFKIDPKSGNLRQESDFVKSDLAKNIILKNMPSCANPPSRDDGRSSFSQTDVIFDAYWQAHLPDGKYVLIPTPEQFSTPSGATPIAVGGLFPQASSDSAKDHQAVSTKLWSMLDETRTPRDMLNDWRVKLAYPPIDAETRVPEGTPAGRNLEVHVSGDQAILDGDRLETLEERNMGIQLRTIHVF